MGKSFYTICVTHFYLSTPLLTCSHLYYIIRVRQSHVYTIHVTWAHLSYIIHLLNTHILLYHPCDTDTPIYTIVWHAHICHHLCDMPIPAYTIYEPWPHSSTLSAT